jgi:hypothetical protein
MIAPIITSIEQLSTASHRDPGQQSRNERRKISRKEAKAQRSDKRK